MTPRRFPLRHACLQVVLLLSGLAVILSATGSAVTGQQRKLKLLRIGTSGTLTGEKQTGKEKSALKTLHSFIKDETGLDNRILRQKDWRELAGKLAKGELDLGVFQGYELAWAKEKHPALRPLAIAVNVYRYPVVYVVTRRDNPAKDFGGLKGQSVAMPDTGGRHLRLFVERQCEARGAKPEGFFAKVVSYENVEDALDDVVDGKVQAAVGDRAALEGYKRRKPGRFKQLREVAHSAPFPPPVIVYYDSALDETTLRRFRDGLLKASRTERGETMLTFFRLTGFETVPSDFERVLAQTRKNYPPPSGSEK